MATLSWENKKKRKNESYNWTCNTSWKMKDVISVETCCWCLLDKEKKAHKQLSCIHYDNLELVTSCQWKFIIRYKFQRTQRKNSMFSKHKEKRDTKRKRNNWKIPPIFLGIIVEFSILFLYFYASSNRAMSPKPTPPGPSLHHFPDTQLGRCSYSHVFHICSPEPMSPGSTELHWPVKVLGLLS